MLGSEVRDRVGLEGGGDAKGLGLLPIRTDLSGEKITAPARGRICNPELFGIDSEHCAVDGYEIHLGETIYERNCAPFAEIYRRPNPEIKIIDGATSADGKTWGTYLHGIFDADDYRHQFIRRARRIANLSEPSELNFHRAEKEARYDRLAAHVRRSVNLDLIFDWLRLKRKR